MKLGRFERKIVLAISTVAVVPLLATLVLGESALREVYGLGVNADIRRALERSLAMDRAYLLTQKQDGELAVDTVANDRQLHAAVATGDADVVTSRLAALSARHPAVARLALLDAGAHVLAEVHDAARLEPDTMRTLTFERAFDGDLRVQVTVATEAARFLEYQQTGQLVDTYGRLESSSGYLSSTYLFVYIALLFAVIVIALAVGIVLSRRVTRRVAVLARATQQVGQGDLAVEVPTDGNDEVGELTHAFNQMVQDLRMSRERIDYLQRIGAWQQFARRLAHEIKNPLTPIQLAVQEVHRSYRGEDDRYRRNLDDALTIVTEEVATLRRLVGEFSAFAKLPEAHLSPSDLNEYLRDVIRGIGSSLPGIQGTDTSQATAKPPREIRLATDLVPVPLPVDIDAMMLRRCLDNLIRNAVQAIEGAPMRTPAQVLVRTRRADAYAILEVDDSGPGIQADDAERVFDPYFTTKSDGTGLGLAIVKKVILEHGGEIRCTTGTLGGACFVVRLPMSANKS